MDFACRSVRFSASIELMSGLGVPDRTATLMIDLATGFYCGQNCDADHRSRGGGIAIPN
jgi:hypothetical protein